jgi:hypothetical protein
LIAKEVGSTYLNREFYGLENNSTSIAKFKIKVDVVEEETEKEVINIQVNAQV